MATTTPIIIRHSSEDVENVMDDVFSEDLLAFNSPVGNIIFVRIIRILYIYLRFYQSADFIGERSLIQWPHYLLPFRKF